MNYLLAWAIMNKACPNILSKVRIKWIPRVTYVYWELSLIQFRTNYSADIFSADDNCLYTTKKKMHYRRLRQYDGCSPIIQSPLWNKLPPIERSVGLYFEELPSNLNLQYYIICPIEIGWMLKIKSSFDFARNTL